MGYTHTTGHILLQVIQTTRRKYLHMLNVNILLSNMKLSASHKFLLNQIILFIWNVYFYIFMNVLSTLFLTTNLMMAQIIHWFIPVFITIKEYVPNMVYLKMDQIYSNYEKKTITQIMVLSIGQHTERRKSNKNVMFYWWISHDTWSANIKEVFIS